jgi:hypothetical protein
MVAMRSTSLSVQWKMLGVRSRLLARTAADFLQISVTVLMSTNPDLARVPMAPSPVAIQPNSDR